RVPHPGPPLQIIANASGTDNLAVGLQLVHKEKHVNVNVDLDKLEEFVAKLKPTAVPKTGQLSTRLWGAIPEQNPNYLEREKIPLKKLSDFFSDLNTRKLLAIIGSPGVGKTQALKEFVYRNS